MKTVRAFKITKEQQQRTRRVDRDGNKIEGEHGIDNDRDCDRDRNNTTYDGSEVGKVEIGGCRRDLSII